MSERGMRSSWWAVLMAVVLLFSMAGFAGAQDEGAAGDSGEGESEEIDFGAIDDLLQEDQEVLSDTIETSYDPGARRDPFRSLLATNKEVPEIERERPEGPGGLLIDEIEVEGVFILDDGPVAQVVAASEETSYLLRPGDQLWDGDVVSISLNEVVFKQSVDDPTALKPFREVVKRLNP